MDKTRNLHRLLAELMRTHGFEPKVLEQKVFVLWRECLSRNKHLAPLATNTVTHIFVKWHPEDLHRIFCL